MARRPQRSETVTATILTGKRQHGLDWQRRLAELKCRRLQQFSMAIETRMSRPAAASGPVDISSRAVHPVPAWVSELDPSRFRHLTAGFDGARGMDILTFQQRVVEAYTEIFEQLDPAACGHPVRFWAFVPGIHEPLGAGLDRYMAFNAGRYGAFAARFGRAPSFTKSIPTGSAVGVEGDRLLLHCVAADEPGVPVENPRQISAYHY